MAQPDMVNRPPLNQPTKELPTASTVIGQTRDTMTQEPQMGAGLTSETGKTGKQARFFRPYERLFTRQEREHTTVLFEGFTWKHNRLMQGAMQGMGYKSAALPTADVNAYQLGREYGNNGQCCPTYFTVGNLVQHLHSLEKETGLSKKEICDKYIFFTAGACGPCRFGMYEAEYRLALQNSGFGDFRILIIGKNEGLKNKDGKANDGLDLNLELYLDMLNAILTADIIHEMAYRIRPFEINPGETDRAVNTVVEELYQAIQDCPKTRKNSFQSIRNKWPSIATYLGAFWNEEYFKAVKHAFRHFKDIKVDRTRPKPVVKITGEFWAKMTEGDGNFNMFHFLEQEGAEVRVETIGAYIMHLMHEGKQGVKRWRDLDSFGDPSDSSKWKKRLRKELKTRKTVALVSIIEKLFAWKYRLLSESFGSLVPGFPDMKRIEKLAKGYYTPFVGGGEVHLEVGKNIYYQEKNQAHMVLSLKPFGCLPSTQSDGIQSAVVSHFPNLLYLPIETSGEGEINAHSRVQMVLGEAKERAREECRQVLAKSNYTMDQIQEYISRFPELSSPFYKIPKHNGYIGHAANFLHHVTQRMQEAGIPRLPATA